ncbi:SNF2 family N-terminal domain-containing protein [Podospora appendiculata]|uniref:SNF2 family N-terminal domain-containing protein n=1 Tax=Podospora appendiculata TaxID=314037 RepID=A0AAE0XA86_9PEZI|nr:SNF2 family N-terminal domain-containing protein [Podospora appendiculata]
MDDGFLSPWDQPLRGANKRPYHESDRSWTPDDGSTTSKRNRADQSPGFSPFPVEGQSEEKSCGGSQSSREDIGSIEQDMHADLMGIDTTKCSPWVSQIPQGCEAMVESSILGDEGAQRFDTCFGAIELGNVTIGSGAQNKGKAVQEVELNIESDFVIIRHSKSKEFAGFLQPKDVQMVLTLTHTFQATFAIVFKGPANLQAKVYGFQANADSVGQFLSENGYFLQTPDQGDCVPYINPQVLLPPGTDSQQWYMSLETEMDAVATHGQTTSVDSVTKSRIQKVLDSATGPSTFSEALVSDRLKTTLELHQRKALAMMVEKESGNIISPKFPSVWMQSTNNVGRTRYQNTVTGSWKQVPPNLSLGGLLADDMGLGKSLTVLALIAGSASDPMLSGDGSQSPRLVTLIVTPLSTLPNWSNEINKHFKRGSVTFMTYYGPRRGEHGANLTDYEIVITNYETVTADNRKASKTKAVGPLHAMKWHRIVLDEAHIIRNRKAMVFEAVSKLEAHHRWCLTGTPIQNSIEDLGSLVQFLRVTPFNNPASFTNTFVLPIQREDPKGWMRLTSLIKAISLRRTKESEAQNLQLPPRDEILKYVDLDDREKAIYRIISRAWSSGMHSTSSTHSLFATILRLRQVSNHGCDLLPTGLREWVEKALRSADPTFDLPDILTTQSCEYCQQTIQRNGNQQLLPCFHSICDDCFKSTKHSSLSKNTLAHCPICSDNAVIERDVPVCGSLDVASYTPSSKVKVILETLRAAGCDSNGDPIKSLVFSSWTSMLDLLEKALSQNGFRYQRFDGKRSLKQRSDALNTFREDATTTILLATLGSAAVGLDLTAASHIHLVEPGWNPMLERQAMDRVHRLGQARPVKAFRYIVRGDGSIEKHILGVQQRKLQLMSSSFSNNDSLEEKTKKAFIDFANKIAPEPH